MLKILESTTVKHVQRAPFGLTRIAAVVALVLASQLAVEVAQAGAGFGAGVTVANTPNAPATYYANSPAGPVPVLVNGVPTIRTDGSGLPILGTTGTLLRKFVDTLPGFGASKANDLGQYIPVAVPKKWVDLNGVTTADDYYEIAAVEFSEKLHADLPKATHLRGYVQVESIADAPAAAGSLHVALAYPNGTPITDPARITSANPQGQVYAYDNPHHLGPLFNASSGIAVRVKFSNYLPVYQGTTPGSAGSSFFLPVDTTLSSTGLGPDGKTAFTQNRAEMHLMGGQAPWVSAGTPHQWVAPAGETAAYVAGIGKGASAQNVPDMADPGPGSVTLYFPNNMSGRLTFFRDETSGIARLNTYAGLEAAYVISDPIEQVLVNGGTISGGNVPAAVTVAAGTLPADVLPLIFEDKTFVPANIAQQDALWNTTTWGQPGDLWFPHVYEPNQDPTQLSGVNPVGRWDYGPLFWPIFQVSPDKASLPTPSFVPEAYMDTVLVNGTVYPTVTVDPKAYRVRLANASDDRFLNLGFYVADSTVSAPVLDANGNPTITAAGLPVVMANTEVKMIPATAIDAAGDPPGWDTTNNVQLPLPQFGATFPWHINYAMSGPTRAWPVDARIGGVPDPKTSGPDFIQIGSDGGFLPGGVDIPSQPIVYEQNRRSVTVTNVYGYGMLIGPGERADTVVDFTPFAGKTLILYNDAPTPFPFLDQRSDYFTGDPDQTALGGTYTTQPGYGPNTRTVLQVKVNATNLSKTGGPLNAMALAAALPAAYAATQPTPLVTQTFYNKAFGTNNPDTLAHVATGSAAQPNLVFTSGTSGTNPVSITGFSLITSGGAGNGSGSGYLTPPLVTLTGGGGTGALAHSELGAGATAPVTANCNPQVPAGQVCAVVLDAPGTGYTSAPLVTFQSASAVGGVSVIDGGAGYAATDKIVFTGGGGTGATATLTVSSSSALSTVPVAFAGGAGYTVPPTVVFVPAPGTAAPSLAATATTTISASTLVPGTAGTAVSNAGTKYSAYTAPVAVVSAPQLATVPGATAGTMVASTTATATPIVGFAAAPITVPAAGIAAVNNIIGTIDATGLVVTVNAGANNAGLVPNYFIFGGGFPANTTIATFTPANPTLGTPASFTTSAASTTTSASNVALTFSATATAATPASFDPGAQNVPSTAIVTFSAPQLAGGTLPVATAVVAGPNSTSTLPSGTLAGINFTSYGTGYTSPPIVTISDAHNATILSGTTATLSNVATASALAAGTGQIYGVNIVTAGTGYTAPATITFTDATGSGATATAAVLGPNNSVSNVPVGVVNSFTITGAGRGYSAAPTVQFNEPVPNAAPTTAATATVALNSAVGAITGVTLTSLGTGYTSPPQVSITSSTGGASTGSGANLAAGLAAGGVGAQAIALTSNSFSYPVLTKAEQELFDDYGRYNSTGGVELPYTTANIQTTIPLNYNDAPTEVIGDGEVQIWKIVDNGFWSNSMHFNVGDVQLVGRVGWDGTVKQPATNEAGWKDTVRLNPLEDMIVAVQGKRAQAPFGQPRSNRLQDPSVPTGTPSHPAAPVAGVAGTTYVPGMPFTADPGVVQQAGLFAANAATIPSNASVVPVNTQLLTAAVNTNVLPASPTGNYDNEFLWGSAILGHAQDDLQRPVVFNPIVNLPAAPAGLADPLGTGTLTWVDPTPNTVVNGTIANAVVTVGTTTTTISTVTVASTAGLVAGPSVIGGGFPAGTTIAAITSATTFTTSAASTAPSATPVALAIATPANPQNEVGFQVLQAPVTNGKPGAFSVLVAPALLPALVPANTVSYVEPAALVSPTPPNGQFYAYEVVAYNAAGTSTPSNYVVEAPPAAPTMGNGIPLLSSTFVVPASSVADVAILAQWQDNASNETNYIVTRKGGAGATPVTTGSTVTAVSGGATIVATLPPNEFPISTNTTLNDTPTGLSTTANGAANGAVSAPGWTAPVEGAWYEYDIVAHNGFGNSTPVLVGTILAPISVPLAPTNLLAKSTVAPCSPAPVDAVTKTTVPVQCKPNDIVLTWTNNAFNDTGYTIDRAGGAAFTQVKLAANSTTWTDHLAAEGITYTYTVSAINTSIAGTPQAGVASVSSSDLPTVPTIPSNVMVTVSTALVVPGPYNTGVATTYGTFADTATITWSDNAYNESSYQVYRDGVAVSPQLTGTAIAGGALNNPFGTATTGWLSSPVLSYTDTGLGDGTTHSWTVVATNTQGSTGSAATTATMKGIIINPPTNVVATPNRAGSSIALSWTDNSSNETDFLVEESVSTTGGAPGSFSNWSVAGVVNRSAAQEAATGGRVNFNRAGVATAPGYVYTFRISARNQPATSDSHPYVYAQASLLAPAVPAAPTLNAPVVRRGIRGTTNVNLTWTAIAPAAGTTISYLVFANGTQIAATGRTNYAYVPTQLALDVGITYTVEAVATAIRSANPTAYGSSTSAPSNAQVLAAAPAAPAAPTGLVAAVNAATGAVTLSFTPVTPATGTTVTYLASVNGGGGVGITSGGRLAVAVGASYSVAVATVETNAQGVSNVSAYSAPITVDLTAWPQASTALVLTLPSTRNFNLTWTNASTNITGWTIQVGLAVAGRGTTWTTVAPPVTKTGTTYSFTNTVSAAGTYRYRVTAVAGTLSGATATSPAVVTP